MKKNQTVEDELNDLLGLDPEPEKKEIIENESKDETDPEPNLSFNDPTNPIVIDDLPNKEENKDDEGQEKSKNGEGEGEKESKKEKDPTENKELPSWMKQLQLDKLPENKEEIGKVLENVAKRLTDTQRDWDNKQKQLKELEKKLDSFDQEKSKLLEKVNESESKVKESSYQNLKNEIISKFSEDPEAAIGDLITAISSRIDEAKGNSPAISEEVLQEKIQLTILNQREQEIRSKYEDGNDAVDAFIKAAPADPSLQEDWVNSGKDPEKAYQLGKKILKAQKILADPDKYEQEIIEKYKQENKQNGTAKKSGTLSSITSKGVVDKKPQLFTHQDEGLAVLGL